MAKRTRRQPRTKKQIEARPAVKPTPEHLAKGNVIAMMVTYA
jgi:hypothetical protein